MRVILGFLLLFSFSGAYAQTMIGGKTAFAISKHHFLAKEFQDKYAVKFLPGYNIGLSAEFGTKSKFSLISELTFASRGTRINEESAAYIKNRVRHSIIEAPILLKTTFSGNQVKPYITFGPIIQYRLKTTGKVKADELDEMFIDELSYNVTTPDKGRIFEDVLVEDINNLLFGLGIGLGAEFKMIDGQKYLVEFRYENGHTVISDSNELTTILATYDDSYRANIKSFSLSITYFFDLKALRKSFQK